MINVSLLIRLKKYLIEYFLNVSNQRQHLYQYRARLPASLQEAPQRQQPRRIGLRTSRRLKELLPHHKNAHTIRDSFRTQVCAQKSSPLLQNHNYDSLQANRAPAGIMSAAMANQLERYITI